jgi:hypothetical protein
MAYIVVETAPVAEPVTLAEVKLHLGIGPLQDSDRITSSIQAARIRSLITAAREYCERFTRRSLISKGYCQTLDCFPYFTDTIQSQQAYPPSYYSLPRYATTLWNYSQMIKLFYSPLVSVSKIRYVGSDSQWHELHPATDMADASGDFLADTASEPPRLFPRAGGYWPPCLYVPNAVELHYTAGYGDNGDKVPASIKVAIKELALYWYRSGSADQKDVPKSVEMLLWNQRVLDVCPTRG